MVLMMYVLVTTGLGKYPDAKTLARIVFEDEILIDDVYCLDEVVGMSPFVVYLIVPPGVLSESVSVCDEG